MAKAYLINTSGTELNANINNGVPVKLPAANSSNGQPLGTAPSIAIQNSPNPMPGQLHFGLNQVSLMPIYGGDVTNFTLDIPRGPRIDTLQLYLFRADSHTIVWVANVDGIYSSDISGSLNR